MTKRWTIAVGGCMLPEFLYRIFDARGRLLYIGITGNLRTRILRHSLTDWWPTGAQVTVEVYPNRVAALLAERLAVAAERPLVNVNLQLGEGRAIQVNERPIVAVPGRLEELGKRHRQIMARIERLRPKLDAAIRKERAAGATHVNLWRRSGYKSLGQIRRILQQVRP
jgi:hypothetical protein